MRTMVVMFALLVLACGDDDGSDSGVDASVDALEDARDAGIADATEVDASACTPIDGRCFTWTELPRSTPAQSAIVYDAARDRTVLFGGLNQVGERMAETWEHDGTRWTRMTPLVSPPARSGHALLFDSVRDRVVLVGGAGVETDLSDVWEYDGTTWVEVSASGAPLGAMFAFDAGRGRIVAFQDREMATWEYDGTWAQVATESAPPPGPPLMAYDVARSVVVLVTFQRRAAVAWEWDGTAWSEGARSPFAGLPVHLVYDTSRGRMVLLMQNETTLRTIADYDGVAWNDISPSPALPDGVRGSATYDSTRERLVLFDERMGTWALDATWSQVTRVPAPVMNGELVWTASGSFHYGWQPDHAGTTWLHDGIEWSELEGEEPPRREGHALAYDAARERVVLFGGRVVGEGVADTWEHDGSAWSEIVTAGAPSARAEHAMAYDAARGRVVLFGGVDDTGDLDDTWEYDGVNWVAVDTEVSPPSRERHAMVYDVTASRIVLFGTVLVEGGTWQYDGSSWSEIATDQPAPRFDPGLAFDVARDRVVLFGGFHDPESLLRETWELVGTEWMQVEPAASPLVRMANAMAYDAVRERVVLVDGPAVWVYAPL